MDYKNCAGVYILTNKLNGKVYVGESLKLRKRLTRHKSAKDNQVISGAIHKYGWDNFLIEVHYLPDFDKPTLIELEEQMIIRYKSLTTQHGYNVCKKGLDNSGIKRTSEVIAKFKGKNNPNFGKRGANSPNFGKKHSEESISKMRNPKSKAHKENMRKANILKAKKGSDSPNFGKLGADNPTSKPVSQYSKDGVLIKTFSAIMEAERDTGLNHSNINKCCLGKAKSAGGFIWVYSNRQGAKTATTRPPPGNPSLPLAPKEHHSKQTQSRVNRLPFQPPHPKSLVAFVIEQV